MIITGAAEQALGLVVSHAKVLFGTEAGHRATRARRLGL